MPLFPELGPVYYNETDRPILSLMESRYAESITILQSFWGQADRNFRAYAGDASLWSDMFGNMAGFGNRRTLGFNHIRPIISMVEGHQRKNRKSSIVIPVENGDDATADQFTKVLMWINRQEGVLETVSDAFRGALIGGMNLLHVWVDYRNDPISGNIKVDNCAYNSFLIDPYFRKADLSDCNFIWKRSFLTKREVISLMPDKEEIIMGLQGSDSGGGRDGKFQFMPEQYSFSMKNLLAYDEYYYRDSRNQRMLVDTETGEIQEWRNQDNQEALEAFLAQYPQITVIDQEIPTVKLAIVVQGKVMYNDAQPTGLDVFPFSPVWCYYQPEMPDFSRRIQGMVSNLVDPQYLYNRRKIIELDILESQINSGWKYKENALVNPKDIFLSGEGKGLALKEEAQMTDVEKIQPADIPPSMMAISESLGQEIMKISGVSEELLGSAIDDKAGVLAMLRQGAGLTTLQGLFDNLDRSQKLLYKIILDVIQMNFTPGKVMKILEEEPSQQFYNKSFGKYDVAIEDGINTTTQKQMQFAQLINLKEIGLPIPDDVLLDACTLQNKKQLIEAIQQQQQQQSEMQQRAQEIEMQLQQAQIELAKARTMADQGLGMERVSRIEENQALATERRAEARKDDDIALLNMVKAMKELDSIDIDHLHKLFALQDIMRTKSAVNEQAEKALNKDIPEQQQIPTGQQTGQQIPEQSSSEQAAS